MSVTTTESGQRSVQAEVEVPGSADEVWHAVATGAGISSWFVPTRVDERVGGLVTASFGPGMDSVSSITAWDPPRRFAAESRDDMGPEEPTVVTEWSVEARAGGCCTVRVAHRWVADGDEWDERFEGHASGWQGFFRILKVYLAHFAAEPCAAFQLLAQAPEPQEAAWLTLAAAHGIGRAQRSGRVRSALGAPRLSGRVEHLGDQDYPETLLLRVDEPAPGLVHLFAMPMAGQVFLPVRVFLYGEQARETAEREEPIWREWLERLFPLAE